MNTVRDVLEVKGREVHFATAQATVADAVIEMCRVRVGALMVLDQGKPVGIVSERDLMVRVLLERRDPATTKVEDIMTKSVVCIDLGAQVEEAMALMTHQRCRHLPVVMEGRVVGLVSIGDLVRWMSRDREFELRMLHEYVAGRYPG